MILNVSISVTEADKQHGTAQDCRYCPFAIAINRELTEGYAASVGPYAYSIVRVSNDRYGKQAIGSVYYSGITPWRARDFIRAVDGFAQNEAVRDEALKPFTTTIELPQECCGARSNY